MNTRHQSRTNAAQAALFVDYENLHHVISTQNPGDQYPDEYAAEILDELRHYLRERADVQLTVQRSYADFGALDGDGQFIQRALHLDGIDPRFVSGSLQKNAAELALCIDAAEVLSHRQDLSTAVIVTGNRAYLPLAQRLAEHGCKVLIVALFPPSEEDLPRFAQEDLFMDARSLLSDASRQALLDGDYQPSDENVPYRKNKPAPEDYAELDNPMARRTIEITEEFFGQYDEVYLTPLLRKLSDILGPEHDPKSLISDLENAGAVRLEKRNGYPYDYTVLIVHDDHPDVRSVQDAPYPSVTPDNGYHDATDDDYEDYDSSESDGTPESVSDTAYDDYEEPYDENDWADAHS